MTRVFLDANVYFAGFYSPRGASALILECIRRGRLQAVASRLALREADRNLRRKAPPRALAAFHRYLKATKLRVVSSPSEAVLARYEPYIHPKDVPILAAAVEAQVDYLITLDRRHFFTPQVSAHAQQTRIVTPGEFLSAWLRVSE